MGFGILRSAIVGRIMYCTRLSVCLSVCVSVSLCVGLFRAYAVTHERTSNKTRRRAVEMYASSAKAGLVSVTLTFDLWPLTLKSFSAMISQTLNICGKFHWHQASKYSASRWTGIITDSGQWSKIEKRKAFAAYCCWQQIHENPEA